MSGSSVDSSEAPSWGSSPFSVDSEEAPEWNVEASDTVSAYSVRYRRSVMAPVGATFHQFQQLVLAVIPSGCTFVVVNNHAIPAVEFLTFLRGEFSWICFRSLLENRIALTAPAFRGFVYKITSRAELSMESSNFMVNLSSCSVDTEVVVIPVIHENTFSAVVCRTKKSDAKWFVLDPANILLSVQNHITAIVSNVYHHFGIYRYSRISYRVPDLASLFDTASFVCVCVWNVLLGSQFLFRKDFRTRCVEHLSQNFEVEVPSPVPLVSSVSEEVSPTPMPSTEVFHRLFPTEFDMPKTNCSEAAFVIQDPTFPADPRKIMFSDVEGGEFKCTFDFDGVEMLGESMNLVNATLVIPPTAQGIVPLVRKSKLFALEGRRALYVGTFAVSNVNLWMLFPEESGSVQEMSRGNFLNRFVLPFLKTQQIKIPFGFSLGKESLSVSSLTQRLLSEHIREIFQECFATPIHFYVQKFGMKCQYEVPHVPAEILLYNTAEASKVSFDFAAVVSVENSGSGPLTVFANVNRSEAPDETIFRRFFAHDLGGFTIFPKNDIVRKLKVYTMDFHAHRKWRPEGSSFFLDLWQELHSLQCLHSSTTKRLELWRKSSENSRRIFLENLTFCQEQAFGLRYEVSINAKDFMPVVLQFHHRIQAELRACMSGNCVRSFKVVPSRTVFGMARRYVSVLYEMIQQCVASKKEHADRGISLLLCLLDFIFSGDRKHLGGYNRNFSRWVTTLCSQLNMFPLTFRPEAKGDELRIPVHYHKTTVLGRGKHGNVACKQVDSEIAILSTIKTSSEEQIRLFLTTFIRQYEEYLLEVLNISTIDFVSCTRLLLSDSWIRVTGPQGPWGTIFVGAPEQVAQLTALAKHTPCDRYILICTALSKHRPGVLMEFKQCILEYFSRCTDIPAIHWRSANDPVLAGRRLVLQQPRNILSRPEALDSREKLEVFFSRVADRLGLRAHQTRQFVSFLVGLHSGKFDNRSKTHVPSRVFLNSGLLIEQPEESARIRWVLRNMEELQNLHGSFYSD